MKVAIVGSGIVGITTAYFLSRRGLDVQVVDRACGPGRETSYANGALIHPSYVSPWNEPGIQWQLLRWLGRETAPMLIRPRHISRYFRWGLDFLAHSKLERFSDGARRNFELARHSQTILAKLRDDLALQYDQYARGSLRIFRDEAALCAAADSARRISTDVRLSLLDPPAALALEPALAEIAGELAGALHSHEDEGGDAHQYCVGMAEQFQAQGGRLRFDVDVEALQSRHDKVVALLTSTGEPIEADVFVLACANDACRLLSGLGVRIPVRPVKGYSVTLPTNPGAPKVPVIDADLHAAVVPLGEHAVRLAGTAEFSGEDLSIPPKRIDNLLRLLERVFPSYAAALEPGTARPWAGLRPMSADGVPLIGRIRMPNLFVNTGHGQIGWTTGPGSGELLSALILGDPTTLEPQGYAPDRFSSKRQPRQDGRREATSAAPTR